MNFRELEATSPVFIRMWILSFRRQILYIYIILAFLMLEKGPTIDLKDLSGFLLNLVCDSCEIMSQFSSQAGISWKGKDNPVTEVDYLIQQYIVEEITNKYGKNYINVVAQEDLSYSLCPQFQKSVVSKLSEVKGGNQKIELPKCVEFQKKYEVKELCVWIDPLDCTQGFINDRKHEVTILVGISYKGRPICGVIGHPYKPNKKNSIYSPSVYYGSSELNLGSAFEYNMVDRNWNVRSGISEIQCEEPLRKQATVGYRKMSVRQEGIVKKLGLSVVRAGGAGYKCLKLINRQVGSIIFIDAKTSKWDTCAGQAIIRGMGGFTASQNSEQIEYLVDKSYENATGFVFSLFEDVVQAITSMVS